MTDLDWLKAQRTQHKGLPLPQHLAVIMDGNGRWAERWDLSRKSGHHEGAKALRKTVEACYYLEIPYLTLYAFSMENWCRDDSEIADLMELIVMYLRSERDALKEHNIRLHIIGKKSLLPDKVRREITLTQQHLKDATGMTLTLALSYSAREEITKAVRDIAHKVAAGQLHPKEIRSDHIESCLATAGIPDPDLLIRTSGEMRLSNFLLWQMAYTEFYFSDALWPEFNARLLWQAIMAYSRRKRRFGRRTPSRLQPNQQDLRLAVNQQGCDSRLVSLTAT